MKSQTFRQSSCVSVAGALLGIVGGVISGISFYHLITGIPLWQADGKFHSGLHIASNSELWFGGLGGLPLFLFGLAMILMNLNSATIIDETGISATDLFRRVTFRANWSEITSFERMQPGSAASYKLTANGKSLQLDSSITGFQDLVKEVKARTRHRSDT